jgi:hypothetical protein
MRLKISLAAFSLSLICLVPRTALADTITLTNAVGGSTAGVDIYPYQFTVASGLGTELDVLMSCLNFNREVTFGESWLADPLNLSTVSPTGTYDGESGVSLREDAWLFNQYGTAAATDSEIQFAIWSILDPRDINASNPSYNGPNAFDATAQSLVADAISEVTGNTPLPASYFETDVAYLPDPSGKDTWTDGEPQIFMVDPPVPAASTTPEPSSLFLLGTGFGILGIALAGTSKRRSEGNSLWLTQSTPTEDQDLQA